MSVGLITNYVCRSYFTTMHAGEVVPDSNATAVSLVNTFPFTAGANYASTSMLCYFVLVVILCGSEKFVRNFMLTAQQLHMTDGQYVYVVAGQVPPENVKTPWVAGDDQDETARFAFESVLQVCIVRNPIQTKAAHDIIRRCINPFTADLVKALHFAILI